VQPGRGPAEVQLLGQHQEHLDLRRIDAIHRIR